jgi:hypothetical protein
MENELSILMRHELLYREEYTARDLLARKSDGWFETNFGRFFLLCGFYEGPYILIKYGYLKCDG